MRADSLFPRREFNPESKKLQSSDDEVLEIQLRELKLQSNYMIHIHDHRVSKVMICVL
jgi:hypothetical protein